MKPAKTIHRIAAYIFDFTITGVITLGVVLLFSPSIYNVMHQVIASKEVTLSLTQIFSFYKAIFMSTLLISAYFTLVPYLFQGQTFGKRIFRIKVVNADGSKISLRRLFIREIFGKFFLNFVSFFFGHLISFILLQSRKDRKSIADVLADTMVVDA